MGEGPTAFFLIFELYKYIIFGRFCFTFMPPPPPPPYKYLNRNNNNNNSNNNDNDNDNVDYNKLYNKMNNNKINVIGRA